MKIIYLFFYTCILFSAQALGCDAGDHYAHELWEKDKERVVTTGVSSPAELSFLEGEGAKIVSNFIAAQEQEDPEQADLYRAAFAKLVDHFVALSAKADLLPK